MALSKRKKEQLILEYFVIVQFVKLKGKLLSLSDVETLFKRCTAIEKSLKDLSGVDVHMHVLLDGDVMTSGFNLNGVNAGGKDDNQ